MVIEIALGVVSAVLILRFLPVLLPLVVLAIAGVLTVVFWSQIAGYLVALATIGVVWVLHNLADDWVYRRRLPLWPPGSRSRGT